MVYATHTLDRLNSLSISVDFAWVSNGEHLFALVKQFENRLQRIDGSVELAIALQKHQQGINRVICLMLLEEAIIMEADQQQGHQRL